jgi:hypothetical protein
MIYLRSAIAAALLLPAASFAADTYVIPQGAVRAEAETNRGLRTENEESIEGVIGDFAAILGVATQRSDTQIRPRIRLQEFSDRDAVKRTEQLLDMKTGYKSVRSEFDMSGRYAKRDTADAELARASFDEFNPDAPTGSEGGRVTTGGEARTQYSLQPSYRYQWSERAGGGVNAQYQKVKFDENSSEPKIGFEFSELEAFLLRAFTERVQGEFGAYVTKYETDSDVVENTTDSYGLSVNIGREWTPRTRGQVELRVERNEVELFAPGIPAVGASPPIPAQTLTDTSTDLGLMVSGIHESEVAQLRFGVGRILRPSTLGGKTTTDEVRAQLDRNLSQRAVWSSAIRYERQRLVALGENQGRDYASLVTSLQYLLTPTWFVGGGYEYFWQEFKVESDDANSHRVFIEFGYKGLRQTR